MNATSRPRALVICPGRGTYNKEELGYFHKYHSDRLDLLATIDAQRTKLGQLAVADLDNAQTYDLKTHTAGENASSLIYACAKADYDKINQDKFDVVAITGNSMGWYISCAVANALQHANASHLINTMGSMMSEGIIGGQCIYPVIDENWHLDKTKLDHITKLLASARIEAGVELHESIRLGGYVVLGGNDKGLSFAKQQLPEIDNRYPMKLFNHAAFHTPLLDSIVGRAQSALTPELFETPSVPLIDGEGQIWQPHSTSVEALYDYTLGTQVNCVYDFTLAVEVAIKEFAPDKLIILGPGATLGGAVAQILIKNRWFGLSSKTEFIERQKQEPVLISMGMEQQRPLAID